VTSYFFAIEQAIRRASASGLQYDIGHATRPHGALSMLETNYDDSAILASDSGYCTQPTDPLGPTPYPPRVQEAFAIDAMVNLDPTASAVGASWGAIKLANNDGKYDPIINGGWTADGRDTHILYGVKEVENFDGVRTARSTAATRLDRNNTLALAAPGELRQDYTGALTIDQTATNSLRNSSASGAVLGTIGAGGVMPAGWQTTAIGLTIQLLATYRTALAGGTATVLRLRYHGTTGATSGTLIYSNTGGLSGLPVNQPVAQSVSIARAGGSFSGVTQITHYLVTADATGTGVASPQPNFLPSITTNLTRVSRTLNLPATGVVPFYTAAAGMAFYWASGAAIDFTIDVVAPQVELGAVATPFIATSAGEVTHGDGTVNYIPHGDMSGAVTGTPGTLPTGWSVNLGTGISQQVVAIGTDAGTGLKYIDLRFFGTTGSTLTNLHFTGANAIDANTGQKWCMSVYALLAAGSQAGITFAVGVQETDGTAFLVWDAETQKQLAVAAIGIGRTRRVAPVTTANAACRYVQPSLWISYASGVAIDFTVRLMAPQCEGGTVATAVVPTTTAVAARPATYSVTGTPVLLNEADATNYVRSAQTPTVANVTVAASTDVPAIYAGVPVWKHTRTATGADTNCGTIGVTALPTTGVHIRASIWIWLPSSMAAKTSVTLGIEGAGLSAGVVGQVDRTLVDQWQRVSATVTVAAGTTAASMLVRVIPQLAGDVFYTAAWQMEIDTGAPTSFIPPAVAAASRVGDHLYAARNILLDPPYASLVPAFNGVAGSITSDDTEMTIPLRDASYWLERPLLRSTYGGNGQYDGNSALVGTLKPLIIGAGTKTGTPAFPFWDGPVSNVTPVLIDPAALIYQVNDGPIGRIAGFYEGGHSGGWPNAGDVADFYDGSSTPAGQYRTCLARGCIQLGSQPTYAITLDVNGPPIQAPATSLAVAYYALTQLCGVPQNLVGLTANELTAIGSTPPLRNGCGLFLGPQDNPSGLDLLTRILAPFCMKLVACRDGMLRALVLAALPASPTIKAVLDDRNIINITPIDLPASISPPPYRMRVGYSDNYTIQTSGLSPLAPPFWVQYVATPSSVAQANSPLLQSSIARPNDPPVITGSIITHIGGFGALDAANQSAAQYIGLWGVRRRLYGIEVPFTVGVALEYGDVVSITTEVGDLTGTILGQIVGYSYRSEDASITLRILT
jgi:hypothetical protein